MSHTVAVLTALIPLAPLLACLVTVAGGGLLSRSKSHWPTLVGSGVSLVASLAVMLIISLDPKSIPAQPIEIYRWVSVAGDLPLEVDVGLQVDGLSAAFLLLVTFVTTLITVHAVGRMRDASSSRRFFAVVSLLLFATVMLLLSTNFLELLFFWQLAGLGGYLLTGSRSANPAAAVAARKVFLVNRLTDVALVTGILFIWLSFRSLDFSVVLDDSQRAEVFARNPAAVGMICLCLFAGVMGRCAQFPLFGWLHDACAAPSPVLALLQAATTMPAGVYLVARCTGLFAAAPGAVQTMAFFGAFTALLAAAVAVTATDLKQVLSYTSAGHFGILFVGLATGSSLGIAGALLGLTVHSAVKASLFMAAGDVSRHTGGSTEFRDLGGLRRVLPFSYWMFFIGALVLVSGFWGQNAVLAAVGDVSWGSTYQGANAPRSPDGLPHSAAEDGQQMPLFGIDPGFLALVVTWLTALSLAMIAFAMFRAFFLTFHHDRSGAETIIVAASERSAAIRAPMLVLTVAAVVVGPVFAGPSGLLVGYLGRTWPGFAIAGPAELFTAGVGFLLVLIGIVCAWMLYARSTEWPGRMAGWLAPFTRLSRNRFYLDNLCFLCVVLPVRGAAQLCRFLDWLVIDTVAFGVVTRLPGLLAKAAGPLQNRPAQFYALSLMLSIAVLLTALLWLRG